jgi:thioredoxin 1
MPTRKVTDADFVQEVLNASLPVVVDFWADWCGPCKGMAALLEEIADELAGKALIVKLDVEANFLTAQAYDIQSVPTFKIFKNGLKILARCRRKVLRLGLSTQSDPIGLCARVGHGSRDADPWNLKPGEEMHHPEQY